MIFKIGLSVCLLSDDDVEVADPDKIDVSDWQNEVWDDEIL